MNEKDTNTLACRSQNRDNHFNLIRILAAVGVLVSHAFPISLGRGTQEPLQPWLQGTSLGMVSVFIFFCISGFFITKSFDQSQTLSRFIKARVLRLFPALLVTLLVTVIVAGLWLTEAPMPVFIAAVPEYILRNLTMNSLVYELPGVFESNPFGDAINGSLWTLIYELQCYFGVIVLGWLGVIRQSAVFGLAFLSFVIVSVGAGLLGASTVHVSAALLYTLGFFVPDLIEGRPVLHYIPSILFMSAGINLCLWMVLTLPFTLFCSTIFWRVTKFPSDTDRF